MRKIYSLLFVLFLLGANEMNAQVSHLLNPTYGYTFLNTTGTYTSLTGGTVFQTGTAINTDGVSAAISLPFVFKYNGINEYSIFISNNGFITFGVAPGASNYTPLSITTAGVSGYNGAIAGTGMNCVASTASGAAPEIRYGSNVGGDFVVQFQDIGQSTFATIRMTYQIILKADGKTVQIVFGPNNVGVASANQCQVGLRGTNDEDWNNRTLSSGGNWNTAGGAAGTLATSAMSLTATTTLPASGRTFQWSPTAYLPTYLANAAGVVQEFTTWVNGSGPSNVPTTNFATNGYGNASWQIDNTTASTTGSGWTGVLGAYSPVDYVNAVGGHSARFHSQLSNSPQVGYLDYYVDLSAVTGTPTVDFYHINPTGTDILQVFLSTNGGTSFTQIGSNIGTATSWTARSISLGATNSATTIIRFKATSDFGNDDIGIDHLVVTPPAAPPTITNFTPNNTSLCTGGNQSITITGTNFTGTTAVTFNGVNAISFSVVNATTITAITPVTISAGVITVTNPAASANSAAYSITANPTVTLLPATATICQPGGSAVTLTAGGASTYSYNNTTGLTPTSGSPVSALPAVTTTYTVTGTDANGCINTASSIITVNEAPVVSATATPASICSGANSQLLATGGTTASYSLASNTLSPVSKTGLTAGTFTTTPTGDDVISNSVPIGFNFTFYGNSYNTFVISTNGNIQFGNPPVSVAWTPAAIPSSTTPTAGTSGNTGINNYVALAWKDWTTVTAGEINYYTTGTAPNRICLIDFNDAGNYVGQIVLHETSNVIDIISTNIPSNTSVQGIENSGGTAGVAVTGRNNVSWTSTTTSSYTFTPSGGSPTFLWSPTTFLPGGSETTPNPLATAVTAPITYTVQATSGGCTNSTTVSVAVSTGAVIQNDPVASSKCVGETATFSVTATGVGLTYQWRKGGVDINTVANPSAGTASLSLANVSAADVATYDVVVSSTCGSPVTSAGASLTVNPLPATVIANGAGTFCTSTTITASNGGDGTIYFQGTTSNGISTATPSASQVVSASGTYYFRAQSAQGCWGPQGSVAVVIQTAPGITGTPASICANASGIIAASAANNCVSFVNSGTTFNGTWTAATDPVALRLNSTGMLNENTCSFDAAVTRNYVTQTFQVNVTGNYVFEMTDNAAYDAMAYIVTGAFTPGSCATGTFVRGDDDDGVAGNEPRLGSPAGDGVMTLTAGTTYTLVSTTYSLSSGTVSGTFAWTVTPPGGGQIMLPVAGNIQWYTAASGGSAFGTGSPFNPVGVVNSGLPNTSTPGTTTFYAACSNAAACRTAINFVINPNYTVTASSGANGTVTPAGTTTLSCDGTGDQIYTITPDAGYSIQDVLVDNVSQGAIGTYTFTDVTANHTISATFVINCINVSITSASASPAGPLCSGQTTNLTANGVAGTNALVTWWTGPNGTGVSLGTGTTLNGVGANTYYARVTGDCGAPDEKIVTVGSIGNTFSGTGNWTDNARWSCGAPPNSGDNVTIAAGANATLNTNFLVSGSLTMTPTSTLTVNPTRTLSIDVAATANFAGQSVTFLSDGTGTASLGQVNGTLSGATNVTVERYIPNNGFRSWRLLSVPVTTTQTIRQAWQEGDANPLPKDNNIANYGTQITGVFNTQAAAAAAGFDSTSVLAGMLRWNGTGWSNITSTNQPINNFSSYFLYIRGDRSQTVTGTIGSSSATTLRTKGTVFTGDQVTNVGAGAFALIPNLYPSAINFSGLERIPGTGGVNNTFYIWDSKKLNGSSLGVYQTFASTNSFNCLISGGSYTLGQPNTTIESGQSFFVSSTAAGTITLKESAKVSGTNGSLGFRPSGIKRKIDTKLYNSNAEMLDANAVVFDAAYSKAVSGEDALKLGNPGANFAIENSSKLLAVEGTRPVEEGDAIQYRMWNLAKGTYTLELATSNLGLPEGVTAMLEDSYLGTSTAISLSEATQVRFTVDANAGSANVNRFRLVFAKAKSIVIDTKQSYSIAPNPVENGVMNLQFKNQAAGKYSVRILAAGGQSLAIKTIAHAGGSATQNISLPATMGRGTYTVEITAPDRSRTTHTVLVNRK